MARLPTRSIATRLLLAALVALLVLAAGAVLTVTSGSPEARHQVASSLRGQLRPVVPAPVPVPSGTSAAGASTGGQPDAGQLPPAPHADAPDVSNVLLLGLDRSGPKITGRTDAMIVASFRHSDGKVAAMSIPRDLWIEIPDRGPARMNSVMRIGNLERGPGQGVLLLREIIERELGIEIHHHIAVDFAGFVTLVDELGGVTVEVQCPLRDCFWTGKPGQACEMLELAAGTHRLGGHRALLYSRSRHGRGDRDRTRRQQAVLLGVLRRIREAGLHRAPGLWKQLSPHVETDLDLSTAAYYGAFAIDNRPADVRGMVVRHPITARHITPENKHVLVIDRERFDAARAELFERPMFATRPRRKCPAADAALTFRDRKKTSKGPKAPRDRTPSAPSEAGLPHGPSTPPP